MIGGNVSHYRILEKLGSGGMGEVYAAEDTLLQRRVAIKFPSLMEAGDARRFLIEARAASRLDHSNISHVYDFGEGPDGRPFLVMEFVQGKTLREVLKEGPLSAARSVAVTKGVLRALREAHRNHVIHRDIKPGNVMLTETGEVKVLDFGLAKELLATRGAPLTEAATEPGGVTRPGVALGTPEYMSPEQARGLLLDQRSDLFAAGLVLYECLTGRAAFSAGNVHEILHRVVHADPPLPSSYSDRVPSALDRITSKALSKEPAQRYQTADQMLDDLGSVAHSLALSKEGRTTNAVVRLLGSRRKAIALCMPVLIAFFAGWLLWRGRDHQPTVDALRWFDLGTAALRDGTYYRAAKELEQAVKADADFALAHARLAEAWTELDDSERAAREMVTALPTRSNNAPGGLAALYMDAIRRTLLRDYSGAISCYTELAGRVPINDRAAVLVDLGRVREKNDDPSRALDAYQEAIRLDPQNAAAHLRVAVVLGRQQKREAAAIEFAKAESLYQSMSNAEGQVEVFYQRGLRNSSDMKLPDARADLAKAIQLAQAISTPFQEIAATLQLSVVTYQEGGAVKAEEMAKAAADRARRVGMWYLVARGLTDLGSAQSLKGDLVNSEANFTEALDISHRFRMGRNEARALFSLASLHQRQGRPEQALNEIAPAKAFYRQANFRQQEMLCLTVIGRANRDLGKEAEALGAFQEQLPLAQALDDQQQVALAEQGIASVLFLQERFQEALDHYQAYYEAAARIKNRAGIARALARRADILWRLGRYAEAEQALKEADGVAAQIGSGTPLEAFIVERRAAMALSRGLNREAAFQARRSFAMANGDPPERATTQCVAGLALARSGSAADGKRFCEEGLKLLIEMKERNSIAEARLAMGEILVGYGDPLAAQEQIRQALLLLEAAGRQEFGWRGWAMAARAYRRSGDRVHAEQAGRRASSLLVELRGVWRGEFDSYIKRPDLRILQREIQN